MNIALYVGASIARGVPAGMSTNNQVAVMEKWAHEEGHTIVEIFEERDTSGYFHEHPRPVFERMVSAAMSPRKPFDLITVHPQSGALRRNAEREILEQKLWQHGVELVIYGRPRLDGEMFSFLARNMTDIFDEVQRQIISKRTAECMEFNARVGFYNGGQPPYGYKVVATDIPSRSGVKKVLAVDEKEAEVLRQIFRLAQLGKDGSVTGMKRIVEELNANDIRHRGTKWTADHVEHVLTNPVCIGQFTTFRRDSRANRPRPKEEWVTAKVAPILEEAEFETVRKLLAERKPPLASA